LTIGCPRSAPDDPMSLKPTLLVIFCGIRGGITKSNILTSHIPTSNIKTSSYTPSTTPANSHTPPQLFSPTPLRNSSFIIHHSKFNIYFTNLQSSIVNRKSKHPPVSFQQLRRTHILLRNFPRSPAPLLKLIIFHK